MIFQPKKSGLVHCHIIRTKDGSMDRGRQAGLCCEAGAEAGAAAAADVASWRTPAVPPDVQLPSAATRLIGKVRQGRHLTPHLKNQILCFLSWIQKLQLLLS